MRRLPFNFFYIQNDLLITVFILFSTSKKNSDRPFDLSYKSICIMEGLSHKLWVGGGQESTIGLFFFQRRSDLDQKRLALLQIL